MNFAKEYLGIERLNINLAIIKIIKKVDVIEASLEVDSVDYAVTI